MLVAVSSSGSALWPAPAPAPAPVSPPPPLLLSLLLLLSRWKMLLVVFVFWGLNSPRALPDFFWKEVTTHYTEGGVGEGGEYGGARIEVFWRFAFLARGASE